jgi:STE24 endopeptidase
VLPVVTLLLLGLTSAGARLTTRVGAGMQLQSLRALLIAFTVVGIAWAVTLPAEAALQAVYDAAGRLAGGWPEWAVGRLLRLVEWWAIAGLAVLAIRASSRLLRRSWWVTLTLVAFVLVLAGSLLSGRLALSEPRHPSLPEGGLRTDLLALADDIGVDVTDVQVVPQSPTTTDYNAYVTGMGGDHVVVLYETLLLRSTRDEVEVVAAHELGHVRARDSERRALLAGLGAALLTALVGAAATSQQVRRRARTQSLRISDAPAVPMLIALTVAAGALVLPVLDAASRAIEVRADFTALQVTHDPPALRAVVARSAVLYLEGPHDAWPWRMLSSHPSPAERIAMADAWQARTD